jgi:DNA-binding beta-propeller fold protein YncE
MYKKVLTSITVSLALSGPGWTRAALAQEPDHKSYDPTRPHAYALGELGRASVTDGAFGLDVAPNGRLYVAAAIRNEILVLDRHSGTILERIGSERGVDGADDVEVADDGSVYWTSPGLGTASVLKPDGTTRTQFVAAGLNPITIKEDGRVFVAAAFADKGLFELDRELLAPPRAILPEITGLNGFDFGRDGFLYCPSTVTREVLRIDVDASPARVEVVTTAVPFPAAVSFDSQDRLHAIDAANGKLFRIDRDSGTVRELLDFEGTLDNLAFSADDRPYMTALADGQVLSLDRNGRLRQLTRGGLIAPSGLAVDRAGTVWAADLFSVRRLMQPWPSPLTSHYTLFGFAPSVARALTVDVRDGDLLVTTLDAGGLVQVIDAETGAVLEQHGDFALPTNGIHHADDSAVAQLLTGSVVRVSDRTPLIEGLTFPLGLASRGSELFVGDWATGNVWSAPASADPRVVAGGLLQPEGIAVFADWLFVVEVGADRVVAVHLPTQRTYPLLQLDLGDRVPSAAPPYGTFNGIAVDARRARLYIASDRTNQVLAYQLVMPRQPR